MPSCYLYPLHAMQLFILLQLNQVCCWLLFVCFSFLKWYYFLGSDLSIRDMVGVGFILNVLCLMTTLLCLQTYGKFQVLPFTCLVSMGNSKCNKWGKFSNWPSVVSVLKFIDHQMCAVTSLVLFCQIEENFEIWHCNAAQNWWSINSRTITTLMHKTMHDP